MRTGKARAPVSGLMVVHRPRRAVDCFWRRLRLGTRRAHEGDGVEREADVFVEAEGPDILVAAYRRPDVSDIMEPAFVRCRRARTKQTPRSQSLQKKPRPSRDRRRRRAFSCPRRYGSDIMTHSCALHALVLASVSRIPLHATDASLSPLLEEAQSRSALVGEVAATAAA